MSGRAGNPVSARFGGETGRRCPPVTRPKWREACSRQPRIVTSFTEWPAIPRALGCNRPIAVGNSQPWCGIFRGISNFREHVMSGARILVVDDEELIRWSLVERMRAEGYDVVEAGTGAQAIEHARDGVDLVLLDYKLPDMDGVTVLRRIKELDPDALVILLTAYASVETAVEAMKEGAFHFANKPFDLDDVAFLVSRALETTQLRREVRRLRASQAQPYSVDRIVGQSTTMEMLRTLLAKVATSPASTVLLTGESGTGKDLAAKVLHYNSRSEERRVGKECR